MSKIVGAVKGVISSKITRIILSIGLIYLAFGKVDILSVVGEIAKVPWWFVIIYIVYGVVTSFIGAYRWALFLFDRPNFSQVWNLLRAIYVAGFYSLFLPSGVASDLIKWLPLQKKYPELTKARLFSSVVVDRVVGFGAYIMVALVAMLLGKLMNFGFPNYLLWLFLGLTTGIIVFYVVVFSFDIESLILKIKFWKFHRLVEIARILKDEDKSRLFKCYLVSVVGEFAWITPVWAVSQVLGAGMSLLSVFIFMPVIGLILILPISVAGFGARESLYVYFFGQLGLSSEKILAVSTFSGLVGVLMSLLGGFLALL